MCDKEYNGWPTYETWAVALWLSNDYGTYHHILDIIRENDWHRDFDEAKEVPWYSKGTIALADWLEEWHEENNPVIGQASVYSDLLSAAFREVDWRYIANHWIEDMQDELEDEDDDE